MKNIKVTRKSSPLFIEKILYNEAKMKLSPSEFYTHSKTEIN